jgi:hypothetical protein
MPQLIAMVIVVVGAMIYMFQTFGGTGDKIEGIAQKTSVITEINNIKNGLKLAARSEEIAITSSTNTTTGVTTVTAADLKGLADLKYFAEQMNDQISKNTVTATAVGSGYSSTNAYNAISFGGTNTDVGGMFISMVADKASAIPGIYVSFNFTNSTLKESAGFLESQIANDLKDVAYIDRNALTPVSGSFTIGTGRKTTTDTSLIAERTPNDTGASTGSGSDGKFIIYFKDFGSNEVVK